MAVFRLSHLLEAVSQLSSPFRGLTLLSVQVTGLILAGGQRSSRGHIGHVYGASRFRSPGLFFEWITLAIWLGVSY